MALITVNDLTTGSLDGSGAFDVLMQTTKAHIQEEYTKGRIKGTEYAQVYLGGMQTVMQNALQLLLQAQRTDLEAQLLQEQILTEQKKRLQIDGEIALLTAQTNKVIAEQSLITAQINKLNSEKALIDAELLNVPLQGDLLTEQVITEQKKHLQQDQDLANSVINGQVLTAQKCKLDAEFDLLVEQKNRTTTEITKIGSEVSLLNQKTVTEQAQVAALGVDSDSIIGRQKALYAAQTAGYTRDAEQKAAKMMIDAAMTQYTKDDVSPAGANLSLTDIAAVVTKLKQGIGA